MDTNPAATISSAVNALFIDIYYLPVPFNGVRSTLFNCIRSISMIILATSFILISCNSLRCCKVTTKGYRPEIDATRWLIAEVTHGITDRGFTTSLRLETGNYLTP
jgi:hypothetical protein